MRLLLLSNGLQGASNALSLNNREKWEKKKKKIVFSLSFDAMMR